MSSFGKSNNEYFRVQIVSDDTPMLVIEAKDKKMYLCAESGKSFIIALRQTQDPPKKFYGVKLFIDGKEINQIKTFKNPAHIYGFKLGNQNYKKFVFDIPPPKEYNGVRKESEEENNRDFGTIRLCFYKTTKVMSKKNKKKNANSSRYNPYCQEKRTEGKKFYEQALSIKEGDTFSIRNSDMKFEYDGYYCNKYDEDIIIDYDCKIDEILFHYTDFFALEIKGVISCKNYLHLQFIPSNVLVKEDYILLAFKSIFNEKKIIHYNQVEKMFRKYTHRKLCEVFKYTDIISFLQNYSCVFKIDDVGYVSLTNIDEVTKLMQSYELPIKPERKYFEFINNSGTTGNFGDKKFVRPTYHEDSGYGNNSKNKIFDNNCISLIDDNDDEDKFEEDEILFSIKDDSF